MVHLTSFLLLSQITCWIQLAAIVQNNFENEYLDIVLIKMIANLTLTSEFLKNHLSSNSLKSSEYFKNLYKIYSNWKFCTNISYFCFKKFLRSGVISANFFRNSCYSQGRISKINNSFEPSRILKIVSCWLTLWVFHSMQILRSVGKYYRFLNAACR